MNPNGDLTLYRSRTLPPLSKSHDYELPVPPQGRYRSGILRKRQDTPSFSIIERQPKSPMTIKALLQVSEPIPKFIESGVHKKPEKTVVKSLQGWKNEVRKVVPSRPAFAISSDWVAPPADWDDRDHYIYSPRCIFYKNIKHYQHKDFTVNPEWVSEKMTVSTFSPAYRTCALRYGWCS
ncbi:hypothetical protein FSP39_007640 [Pinctada imbricata]|uniref:Uncharacterized protein n=1 Tax=Pinctada imbricata TaxID=66713 RepID=A0AA88Y3Q6_PINIB|nr:hypothetical protein FSP39_007640 [Pinctada imbricata]